MVNESLDISLVSGMDRSQDFPMSLVLRKNGVHTMVATGVILLLSLLAAVTPPVSAQAPEAAPSIELSTKYPSLLPFFVEPRFDHSLGPVLTAKSALLYDMDDRRVLLAKDPSARLPIASLTKLMTVVVALESGLDPALHVAVPAEAVKIEPSKIYLLAKDSVTVRDLVRASLIASANDAAYTLASALPDAILAMNRKAYQMELLDTRFSTPVGLDDPDNYSSATDVALLFNYVLTFPLAAEAMHTRHATFTSGTGKQYQLDNTNVLLADKDVDVIAGKTGTTDEAGQCLIVLVRMRNGHRVLGVLLGSRARFAEMHALLTWAEKSY